LFGLDEVIKMGEKEFLKNSKILRDYLKFGSAKNVARIIKFTI